MIVAKIPPKNILPVLLMPLKIEDASERIPIDKIGEKSTLPKTKRPFLLKKFKYGSQIFEINLPNVVNFAPGTQDKIIFTTQRIVKITIAADKIFKIQLINIFSS